MASSYPLPSPSPPPGITIAAASPYIPSPNQVGPSATSNAIQRPIATNIVYIGSIFPITWTHLTPGTIDIGYQYTPNMTLTSGTQTIQILLPDGTFTHAVNISNTGGVNWTVPSMPILGGGYQIVLRWDVPIPSNGGSWSEEFAIESAGAPELLTTLTPTVSTAMPSVSAASRSSPSSSLSSSMPRTSSPAPSPSSLAAGSATSPATSAVATKPNPSSAGTSSSTSSSPPSLSTLTPNLTTSSSPSTSRHYSRTTLIAAPTAMSLAFLLVISLLLWRLVPWYRRRRRNATAAAVGGARAGSGRGARTTWTRTHGRSASDLPQHDNERIKEQVMRKYRSVMTVLSSSSSHGGGDWDGDA